MNYILACLFLFTFISCKSTAPNTAGASPSSLFSRDGKPTIPTSNNVTDYIEDNYSSVPLACPVFVDGEADGSDLPIIAPSNNRRWSPEWSISALDTLNRDDFKPLLNKELKKDDLEKLQCPNFNSMNEQDKKKFYIILISSMAHSESGYKADTYFDENAYAKKQGNTKLIDDSYGLLQIDPGNASGVRKCGVKKVKKTGRVVRGRSNDGGLYNGSKNVECGLVFLKWQLTKQTDGQIFSPKSYWSTLRPKNKSSSKTSTKFNSQIAQISACNEDSPKTVALPQVGEKPQLNTNSKCNVVVDSSRSKKEVDTNNSAYISTESEAPKNIHFDM